MIYGIIIVVCPLKGSLPPENGDVEKNFGGGSLIEDQPLNLSHPTPWSKEFA